ncbi:MAG: hypothetical protein WAK91_16945 [Candidatus Acidiferrales bacterium]|jgi:hypothetical protein
MDSRMDERKLLLSRRDFARKAALAAAGAAIVPAALRATPLAADDLPISEVQAPPATPLSAEDKAQVDARVSAILRKYGDRLSPEQKDEIRRLSTELQKPLIRLRAYPLGNSNQPATVLKLVSDAKPAPAKPAPAKPRR